MIINPQLYWAYHEDTEVINQILVRAKKEIEAGREVTFNGKVFKTYDLLVSEIDTFCTLQNVGYYKKVF